MTISTVSKNQAMRPAEIAAIDALNLAIEQLNELDISGINQRLSGIETSITTLSGRIDTTNSSVSTMQQTLSNISSDVDDIKITLYTPLSEGGN